ncbi:MAG: biotin--[acetyl-CoA-carboxylase] ligase [Endomicrobium sp.]|jgi:BirA family biotin operon repressor/biotin-[acetyl-CoA-carboxylase] ligase|nr:biotin--[acetyl-CoA-carboxylase] ligase [Endomicrobium sp.]
MNNNNNNIITKTCNIGIFKTIQYYKEVISTQIVLKELAERGYDEGLVVVAEKQTGGYGRSGNIWSSNIGGAWFSMLLKPNIKPDDVKDLLLLLSHSIKNVIEQKYYINCELKWPNDVIVYGKKIAGSMIEMSTNKHNRIKWLVAGVGINLNNHIPEDLIATSIALKTILKKEINVRKFIVNFITNFTELYTQKINKERG